MSVLLFYTLIDALSADDSESIPRSRARAQANPIFECKKATLEGQQPHAGEWRSELRQHLLRQT